MVDLTSRSGDARMMTYEELDRLIINLEEKLNMNTTSEEI